MTFFPSGKACCTLLDQAVEFKTHGIELSVVKFETAELAIALDGAAALSANNAFKLTESGAFEFGQSPTVVAEYTFKIAELTTLAWGI